jgi:DNA invertase Pin-like site-specific DNA recombinase
VKTSDDLSSCRLQRDVCRSYVESQCALGWVLISEPFDDEGYSGATLDRPALDRLLALVNRGLVDQVIVHRLDRLSRSLRDCSKLLHDFRRVDVGLVVATAPKLGYSAQDSFMLNILASFAEFEREMIAARIADTRARLKQRHLRFAGGVPFGYDAARHSKQLVPNIEESAIVKWMFAEAVAGKKPADIAAAANGLGYRTKVSVALRTGNKRGGNLWTARQVVATLRNPVHIGMLRDGDGARVGCHEAIIGDSVIANVAEKLDSRRTRKTGAFVYGPIWPLKGKITCGACARPLMPHSTRRGNKVYRYYRCRSTAGGRAPCGYQIAAGTIESAVADVLPRAHRDELNSHRIRTHVESVLYDNKTWTVTVRLVSHNDKTVAFPLDPPDEFANSDRK